MGKVLVFDFASVASLNRPDLINRVFGLRQERFNDEGDYGVPSWRGLEFDKYDNLSTAYLVRLGDAGTVLGCVRIVPTQFTNYKGSMIGDMWPNLVEGEVPSGEHVYEGSRFVVSQTLSANPELRNQVISELVLGIAEFGLSAGAEQIMGVMYPRVWQSVFERRGWGVQLLGPETNIGTDPDRPEVVCAGTKMVSREAYRSIQKTTGIEGAILEIAPTMYLRNSPNRRRFENEQEVFREINGRVRSGIYIG